MNIKQEANPNHRVILADGTKVKGLNKCKHEPKTIISIGDNLSDKVLIKYKITKHGVNLLMV